MALRHLKTARRGRDGLLTHSAIDAAAHDPDGRAMPWAGTSTGASVLSILLALGRCAVRDDA